MHSKLSRSMIVLIICLHDTLGSPRWDGLKLRFGIFKDMPRTETSARDQGFTQLTECDENPRFRGKQYTKDNDTMIILLFDVNGYIAGIQTGVQKGLSNGFPKNDIQPPFIEDGEYFKLTAYFIDPTIICRRGRSGGQFQNQGTGSDLFIQNGNNPEEDILEIEHSEANTTWAKGLCFPKMGFHYFKDLREDMQCDTFFPVATLYYNGLLTGFVWSFGAILNSTVIDLEYPEPEFFKELMQTVPTCLQTLRRSTLHVYLEGTPETSYSCDFTSPSMATICSSFNCVILTVSILVMSSIIL